MRGATPAAWNPRRWMRCDASAITRGKLAMPKVSTPSQQTALRNHPSWDNDPAAKAVLGTVISKWLASGVLEYVGRDDWVPVLLQPCGAVPKGTAPFIGSLQTHGSPTPCMPIGVSPTRPWRSLAAHRTGATPLSASSYRTRTTSPCGPGAAASSRRRYAVGAAGRRPAGRRPHGRCHLGRPPRRLVAPVCRPAAHLPRRRRWRRLRGGRPTKRPVVSTAAYGLARVTDALVNGCTRHVHRRVR